MRDDERELLRAFAAAGGAPQRGAFLRDVGRDLGMHPKRVCYLAGKWAAKGLYDYGVSVNTGWLTDKGRLASVEAGER